MRTTVLPAPPVAADVGGGFSAPKVSRAESSTHRTARNIVTGRPFRAMFICRISAGDLSGRYWTECAHHGGHARTVALPASTNNSGNASYCPSSVLTASNRAAPMP